jgi:hypothetical protein
MLAFRRSAAAALLLAAAVLGCAPKPIGAPAAGSIALPFIENDFPQALAKARDANLPLFVEVWAPW